MNLFLVWTVIFVIIYLFLNWFAKTSSKTISKGIRTLIIILSVLIAIILAIGGRILISLPLFFLALSALKIKGLTAFQIWQIWRLLNYLRATGRYSHFGKNNQTSASSNLSIIEAYKILGIEKGCSKEEVLIAANKLQKKIHPDMNRDIKTERLSQLVNEAKEKILRTDFS